MQYGGQHNMNLTFGQSMKIQIKIKTINFLVD